MGFEPMIWALKDAPTRDHKEFAVLMVMGEAADCDGCNAFKAQKTLARLSKCDDRTVRRCLVELEARGVIARGDQRIVAHLPPDQRPVVWDLQIPHSWFPNISRVNAERAEDPKRRGAWRLPLRPEDRPDLAPAPPKKRRADAGKPKPRKGAKPAPATVDNLGTDLGTNTPGLVVRPSNSDTKDETTPGLVDRPDFKSGPPGLQVRTPRTTSPTTNAFDSPLDSPPPTGAGLIDNSEEEVKVSNDQKQNDRAAEVLAAGLAGSRVPASRHPQGSNRAKLLVRLAELLSAGWPAETLTGRLTGRVGPTDGVYQCLNWRIADAQLGPAPTPAPAPAQRQPAEPCTDKACDSHAGGFGYVERDDRSGKLAPCEHCRPAQYAEHLDALRDFAQWAAAAQGMPGFSGHGEANYVDTTS